jgi:hypothetical protein
MKHFCFLPAALLAIAVTVGATPVPDCTTLEGDNINNVSDFGNGCTLGGLTFSNFSYTAPGNSTNMWLYALGTGVVSGGVNLGFQIATQAPVDISLFYSVSTGGSGPSIIGVDNEQNGIGTTIQEVVCSVPFSDGICPSIDVLANFVNPPNTSAIFAPQSEVYIYKDISLPNGDSSISSFVNSQELSGVPEPTTLLLFGAGMLGIGLFGRRKPQA